MSVSPRRRIKEQIVDEMSNRWKDYNNYLFIDIEKMRAEDMHSLRVHLRKKGVEMLVVKNSLFKRAMKANGIELPEKILRSSTAVIWSKDEIPEICKIFEDWRKGEERPSVKGCYAYERVWSSSHFESFVKLPSKRILQSDILGLLMGSFSTFLGLLQTQPLRLLLCIQQHYERESS